MVELCKAVTAVTKPSTSKKRRHSPSLFEDEKESQNPVQPSPSQEIHREASPPYSPLPLSLDPKCPLWRDALLSPPTLNLTPILIPKVLEKHEQEADILEKSSDIDENPIILDKSSEEPVEKIPHTGDKASLDRCG